MKLIDDTALRLATILYTPEQINEALANWVTMCVSALTMGVPAILIIPGPSGTYEVDPYHRPEPRNNWALN